MAKEQEESTNKEYDRERAERGQKAVRGEAEDIPDLEDMSHEELMDYAREQGLEGVSSDMTDEELVQVLRGEV